MKRRFWLVAAEKAVQKERARAKTRRRRSGPSRSASPGAGQVGFVRRDDWLTPLTIDERSAAYKGAMPSKSGRRASDKGFLGMSFELYLKLLDWTGRQIRRDYKKGRIPADLAPIMERVGLSGELWCDLVKRFGKLIVPEKGWQASFVQCEFDVGAPVPMRLSTSVKVLPETLPYLSKPIPKD